MCQISSLLSINRFSLKSTVLSSVFQFSPPRRASFSLLMPPNYFNLKKNYKQLQHCDAAISRPLTPHLKQKTPPFYRRSLVTHSLSLISVSARVRCWARGWPDGAPQRRLQRALCPGEHSGLRPSLLLVPSEEQTENAANFRLNYKNIFFRNLTL